MINDSHDAKGPIDHRPKRFLLVIVKPKVFQKHVKRIQEHEDLSSLGERDEIDYGHRGTRKVLEALLILINIEARVLKAWKILFDYILNFKKWFAGDSPFRPFFSLKKGANFELLSLVQTEFVIQSNDSKMC